MLLTRVAGLLAQLVEGQGNALWQPHRTLCLTDVYEPGFEAIDLVAPRQARSAACCGGDSAIASLTR